MLYIRIYNIFFQIVYIYICLGSSSVQVFIPLKNAVSLLFPKVQILGTMTNREGKQFTSAITLVPVVEVERSVLIGTPKKIQRLHWFSWERFGDGEEILD